MVCKETGAQEIIHSFTQHVFIEGLLCQQGEYGSEQDKVLALVELTLLWRKQKTNNTQIKTQTKYQIETFYEEKFIRLKKL